MQVRVNSTNQVRLGLFGFLCPLLAYSVEKLGSLPEGQIRTEKLGHEKASTLGLSAQISFERASRGPTLALKISAGEFFNRIGRQLPFPTRDKVP